MKVTFLGSTSTDGDCPTVYETDRGTYLVQGDIVSDPEVLKAVAQVHQENHRNGIPAHETLVEIPKDLSKFFPERP